MQTDSKFKAYKDNSSVYASRDRAEKLIEDFAIFVDINSDTRLKDLVHYSICLWHLFI